MADLYFLSPGEETPTFLFDVVERVSCLLPSFLYRAIQCERLMAELRYYPELAMEDLGCNRLFMGETLCVGESLRI